MAKSKSGKPKKNGTNKRAKAPEPTLAEQLERRSRISNSVKRKRARMR